jgi:aquaporin Z
MPLEGKTLAAWLAEFFMSGSMMLLLLVASNSVRISKFTGWFAGAFLAILIFVEAPLSGMSINPARSFASAMPAQFWKFLWLYFTAPPLGMLLAAQLYLEFNGHFGDGCAKLHHHNEKRCIFCAHHRGSYHYGYSHQKPQHATKNKTRTI